jgi:hypothetical protein
MSEPPKTSPRIVAKSQYIEAQSKRVGLGYLSIGASAEPAQAQREILLRPGEANVDSTHEELLRPLE